VPDTTLSSKKRISYLIQQRRQSRIVRESVITRVTAGEEQESQRFFTGYFESLFGDTVHNLDRDYYSSAPGKLISFRESVRYALSGPRQLLIGAGAGNFSSRIAYKATNLGFSGRYVEKLVYIAPEFRDHHLKLTLRYYMLP